MNERLPHNVKQTVIKVNISIKISFVMNVVRVGG